jgi:acyl-CoA thioesterase
MVEKIARFMRENDKMAVWLNVELLEVNAGYAKVGMVIREDMLNAADVCQGGALFSFADFAFALASNSHGKLALAISANISFTNPAFLGDRLIAEAQELQRTKRTGFYQIKVVREADQKLIAFFSGHVFVKEESMKIK